MEKVLNDFLNPDMQIAFYVVLSVFLGSLIGLERELTNKWAGLRTHILVCLGACVFTVLSLHGFPPHRLIADNGQSFAVGDPARIAAQIITGIGFIGGGTVLRHGTSIHGLTTAATLWMSASIGMACGAGMGALAIGSTILSVSVLVFIRIFEKKFIRTSSKNLKKFQITLLVDKENSVSASHEINKLFINICEFSRKKYEKLDGFEKLIYKVEITAENPVQNIQELIEQNIPFIESISIQEIYE